ncbi:family 10 glycosylhydrolase [Chitinophaga oryzae]|uniref:Family 10 glycosylhydrolase n=1 Tax=Chitinophaga oryzae TaxID=2725414 RepID=A0AAE6ZKN0_9BACT|nr:family 10 glycosylhydrolase [Chitinophaga oryzae]QJB34454.1 family 10 glycosylhydrolase [Chitinophaga oryzae]QJB40971.1 family 10 glycosylhydrolase [Chitinophaga oryzae]
MLKQLLAGVALCAGLTQQAWAQLPPKREMRGMWIATVENIDWPSRRGLPTEQQKQEFIDLLDQMQRNGMNTVVAQVRPATDAFYASPYEPWSEYLTGTQGQAPNPYYDPLQFMIEETHKRGMEFHAWFNPYRAVFNVSRSSVAANHITRLKPQWFLVYDNKKYFDPGIPEVRTYVTTVVRDVVKRYDIDAVHFDDYFYPYRVPGKEFPDNVSYRMYGNGMMKDDWRRANVDAIIEMLSVAIKAEKPWVKFGISPFGVWRDRSKDPEGSYTRGGMTNYDDLYADILKWLKKGWIDYAAPQLYWERGHRLADYEVLLNWWSQHGYGRQIYIGHGVYRLGSNAAWKNPRELPMQIEEARTLNTIQGSVFYSAKSFRGNPLGIEDTLRNHYYKYPALRPVMSWLPNTTPDPPYFIDAFERPGGLEIHWTDDDTSGRTKQYVLYRFEANEPVNVTDPTKILAILPQSSDPEYKDLTYVRGKTYTYVVTALDRLQNESHLSEPLRMEIRNGKTTFIFEP